MYRIGVYFTKHPPRRTPTEPALGRGSGELAAFNSYFDGLKLSKGMEVSFSAAKGALTTVIDGRIMGTISSPSLCAALFGAYLGKDPVAPGAKKAFGDSMLTLLA